MAVFSTIHALKAVRVTGSEICLLHKNSGKLTTFVDALNLFFGITEGFLRFLLLISIIKKERGLMNGKSKCKILKEIRKQIAAENDISYVTSECKHKGDCRGTCPKCEAELRYLEEQLSLRRKAGKAIAVTGVAAALMLSMAGCDSHDSGLDSSESSIADSVTKGMIEYSETVDGQVVIPESSELGLTDFTLPPDYTETIGEVTEDIMGDFAAPEDFDGASVQSDGVDE